jgi:predicted AlkP superfamily pyrophosphatase or phosphodiesterase
VTVYFEDVDEAGHDHGPNSVQVLEAAARLDRSLGQLVQGIDALGLWNRLSIVVVSDHGMSQTSDDRIIVLDEYLDVGAVDVIDWTPILAIAPLPGSPLSADEIYRKLRGRHRALDVYRRGGTPRRLHYREHRLIPPIIALAGDGWRITSRERIEEDRKEGRTRGGDHGYDPKYKSMQGLFVAAGPRIRRGAVVPAFESIHVYNFLCEILGLAPAKNDGDSRVGRRFLR